MLTVIARYTTLLLLILSVAACNLNAENDTPTATNTDVTATPDPASTPVTGDTLTYVDEEVGFAIDYPADWWIDAIPGNLLQIFSAGYAPGIGGGSGFPDDHTKVEIIPQHSGDSRSLDEVLVDMRTVTAGPGGRMISETEVTLAGDITAHRLVFSNMVSYEHPVLLAVINGRLLQVAGYGDTARFDEIVMTLRLWSE